MYEVSLKLVRRYHVGSDGRRNRSCNARGRKGRSRGEKYCRLGQLGKSFLGRPLTQELVGVNLMLIQELIQCGIMRKLWSIQGMQKQQIAPL